MFLSYHALVSEWIHTLYYLNAMKLLARSTREIWSLNECIWTRNKKHVACKEHSTICPIWPNVVAVFSILICTVHLNVRFCLVTYAFHSETRLYSCLNDMEFPAWSTRRSLSDWIWLWTKNHVSCKRTLNHLSNLMKWLSCVLISYIYGVFDCIFLLLHVHVSEQIHIL